MENYTQEQKDRIAAEKAKRLENNEVDNPSSASRKSGSDNGNKQ